MRVRAAVLIRVGGLFLVALQAAGAQGSPTLSRADTVSADTSFFAEGLAVDPRSGTRYVTSLHHRNVLVVSPGRPVRWLLAPDASSTAGAVFGAALDVARETLWLTSAPLPMMASRGAADSTVRTELLEVSVADGVIRRRRQLGAGDGMPGEIAVAPDGSVFVSDGIRGQLYRLRGGRGELETIRSAALRSPQGIALRPDARVAYVADWSRGILRWELATDSIAPVTTEDGRLLRGVDGLRWHEGALIGVQNGASPNRILRIALDAGGTALAGLTELDAPAALEGEMTVGVVLHGEFVYVASSAWPFWTEAGKRRTDGRPLPPVVLRRIPLP